MNPFLNSFTNFIKKINSKTSSEAVMNAIPNLYPELNRYIYLAIKEEVEQYNITEGKKELLKHKLEGSIAATFYFDDDFLNKLNILVDEKDKIYLVRKYVREFIKREVNIETANLITEARNKIIAADSDNPRSFFSIMDPRWKKDAKPGDYSQYKKYRDEVTGYLFPQAAVAGDNVRESEYRKYNKELVDQFNAGSLPLTATGTGAVVDPESSLNSIIDSRHRNIQRGTKVYNSAAGDFLDLDQQIILSNINKGIQSGVVKENLTEKQKIELLKAVQAGDEVVASKFLKDKSASRNVVANLSQTKDRVTVSGGRASFVKSSGDSVSDLRSSSIKEFGDKVKKNPRGAMNSYQDSHLVSNITTIRTIIQREGATVNPELLKFLKKNELLLNISNLGNALKDVGKLTGSAAANLASIKSSVLNAVNNGEIKFASELEKKAFLRALDKNDAAYFKSFTTPGLVGKGTYARLISDVNDSAIELAGKYNSPDLASKALNFNNQLSLFKKNVLDNYIYIAQLGFDQGYVVSEIKQAIKSTRLGKMFESLDSTFTWDSFKKEARKKAINLTIKFGKLVGKDVSQGDLENILGLFSGDKTFGDLLKAKGVRILENILAKFGSKIKLGVEFTWKNFLKSKFFQDAKLKLLKNAKFLEKGLGLLFNKIPFVPYLGKLFSRGWGFVSGYAARFFRIGSIFPGMGGIFGRDDVLTQRIFIAAVGCSILWLLPFLFVLLSMMTFTGGMNSTSSSVTNYEPGLVNDIVLSGYAPFQQTIVASDIATSNSFCVSPKSIEQFEGEYPNWNNLSLKDFDGTDDANVCKIMCNARKYLAGLTPGSNGALSCNFNKSILYRPDKYNEYVCVDFIVDSYRDDDPDIIKGGRLVVQTDKYLKTEGAPKYNRVDLATPNNPDPSYLDNITDYNYQCTELDNFKPGNILIIRANTCNDVGFKSPEDINYLTKDNKGRRSFVNSGHIEIILKVSGSGDKRTLYTLNANNVAKKVSHPLTKCPSLSPSGKETFRMQVKEEGTVLRGVVLDENDKQIDALKSVLTKGYPCRMYQIKERPSVSCPEKCAIPPSNYPDKNTYITP